MKTTKMIMIKRQLIVVIAMLFINVASAQVTNDNKPPMGKASFGIYGGMNFQNINGMDASGSKLANSLVPRFHFGVNEEVPIAPEFYIQLGLQFMSKGTKGSVVYVEDAIAQTITREIKMNYLELLVNFEYKPLVGQGHVILGFGPYFGYCLSGKAEFTGSNAPANTDLKFQKEAPDNATNNLIYFKKMDSGANFFFGYELSNGLNLILNSQLGLININSEDNTSLAEKNTGFGLSLGYRF